MTRRLVASYLGLALLILLVLEVPLGLLAARHERDLTIGQVALQAAGLAAVASEDVEHGRLADLATIVASFHTRTGGEVAVIDAGGRLVASASDAGDHDATTDGQALLQTALHGHSASAFTSDEGRAWATAAVPLSADGQSRGAVLLGSAASSTQDRVHDIWLALAGFGTGILVLTALVGRLLARSVSLPLARLESTVRRFGEGKLSARARDDTGPPQVRSLALQFNQMAGRLAELVDAQNRFVADASHQLRSPLTALRLRLENLEAVSDGPSGDGLAAAGREVQRLSRIVDGLLILSRADGSLPSRQTVDLETVIEDRCDAWSALADERRVDLASEDPGDCRPMVSAVPGDLDQILDNLLANALDASPGGGRIRVSVVSHAGGWVELHVVDEGPGMSGDDRQRAFDRFWQGAGTQGGHSGLGLAIVRKLALRNDATVELRPAPTTGLDAVVRMAVAYGDDGKEIVKKSRDSVVGPR
jgi:signal transduction histidine kinase